MAEKSIKSINLLPEFFRTEKNSKFLSSTIDQLIQPPKLERIDGYIGSKQTPTYNSTSDVYITETSALRRDYQLEPALVVRDSLGKINDVIGIDDLTNEIVNKGGSGDNFDKLYRSKIYAYDPHIDWDKFVNYQEYYWLVNGPDTITITGSQLNSTSTFAVNDNADGTSFIFRPDGLTEDPLITLYRGNTYTFDVDSQYNFYIKTFPSVGSGDQYNIGVSNNGASQGKITIIVDSSTPSTLFYASDDQQNTVGRFNVKTIDQDSRINVDQEIVGKKNYTSGTGIKLSNGMKIRFGGTVIPAFYEDKEFYVEGVGTAIKLIDAATLVTSEAMTEIYNENFDGSDFDSFPFDNFKNLPLVPEYITINRASRDLNPWSRYNRWVHKDIIKASADANGLEEPVFPEDKRARRPIIEFKADLKLWNFGSYGIPDVDFIDTVVTDAFSIVEGSAGHHVDEHLLEQGNRVIFAADQDDLVKNKIYEVNYITLGGKLRLELVEISEATEEASVTITNGKKFKGTNWWFNGTDWIFGQQHDTLNQAPLFELFDKNGVSYNSQTYSSNFIGNKIFGYEVGVGTNDPILGFPLKYKNSSGIGSFTFKNFFSTESFTVPISNNDVKVIPTAITYCRFSNPEKHIYKNVWTETEEYPIPVITVEDQDFYAPPVGLTNNPLNGPIDRLTLSEIGDHVSSMVARSQDVEGQFPGPNNIRDLDNLSKYGTRLVSNLNPISFAQMFIGKKEHSVIAALGKTADQYNQFKFAFLKKIQSINPELSAPAAVDIALTELNADKDIQSSWYNSDMLGYGTDYTERIWTVKSLSQTVFPITSDFTLDVLSKRSVLVYVNGTQLLHGYDYIFVDNDSSVEIITELSVGDTVLIKDYSDTSGSFIPPTPSKLGLYPKFKPGKFTDYSYIDPVEVIQGHDGSITKTYGDYRDDLIIEFEFRIFNNIKIGYKQDLLDINSVLPGAFRSSPFTVDQVNNIISKDFIKWAGFYGIDPYNNSAFDVDNTITWNYSKAYIESLNTNLKGSWRSVFKYLYDTDRPHTHPWEMLGFSEQPAWWEDEYGPAPYTAGNDILWQDIEQGVIRQGTRKGIDSVYVRSGLSDILPVDDGGDLVDPSSLISNITGFNRRQNWIFGDMGPAETAWRRSSYWPYVVQKLLALTQPASYSAFMYDPSRLEKNIAGQWTYGDDRKFLTFSELEIHDDDTMTNGYSVLVSEIGTQRSKTYLEDLRRDLDFSTFNLFYKVGGFVSKEKLQIIIDAIDPISSSPGAILPPEDYNLILNISNPIKTTSISGVIVQKGEGKFIIKGYDTANPYFNVLIPMRTANTPAVTVGGVSESFVTWSASSSAENSGINQSEFITAKSSSAGVFYAVGQIVEYQNQYYRVKTAHRSGESFDPQYFQSMPYLPIKGGATVQIANKFDRTVKQIPYGAEFEKIQDVYDVIVGYGAWLETQGFVFDDFNKDLNSVLNWEFTGKEFLYWTTQNWAGNSVITLSPFADKIKFKLPNSVVDNIFNAFYDYSILQANGIALPQQNLSVNREDGLCTISVTGSTEGIYFATLHNVQKEHAIVFNNQTMFSDTIYDIETGYRQRRMKLLGFRTKDWDGDYFSPGFVYDVAAISEWKTYTDYRYGDVVQFAGKYYSALSNTEGSGKFNFNEWTLLGEEPVAGLLPNFDYKIGQFEDFYSLDIDNFDAAQQKMAQRLIGYTPRVYLNNIFTNPISQYKFYQGFIKEKGTRNSVSKLAKASIHNLQGELDFTEEWAFRVGHFGSYETFKEIEVPLREGKFIENPQVVHFVDQSPTQSNDLIYYSTSSDRLIVPPSYISSLTFVTTSSLEVIKLDTAGFVRLDDVELSAYDINTILDVADVRSFNDGDVVWLANKENGDWDVLRYTLDPARVIRAFMDPANVGTMTFVTNGIHNLAVGDLISISQFDDSLNGVYKVIRIPKLNSFEVSFESEVFVSGAQPETSGLLFKFLSVKFESFNELFDDSQLIKLPDNSKVWISDDGQGKWVVYQKVKNYKNLTIPSTPTPDDQKLGWKITKKKDKDVFLVGAPGYVDTYNTGTAFVYAEKSGAVQFKLRYGLNSDSLEYHTPGGVTDFGAALAYDDRNFNQTGFGLMIVGAPSVSYVKSNTVAGKVNYSTGTETPSLLTNQGAVKFSSIDPVLIEENVERVLVSPNPETNEKFGFSLFVEDNFKLGINTALAEQYAVDVLDMIVNPGTEDLAYDINGDGVIDLLDVTAGYNQLAAGNNLAFTPNPNSNYDSLIWSGKQLFVGAPGTASSGSGSVYKYRIFTTATNSPVDLQYVGKITTSTITALTTGSRWGYAISGSYNANTVAISAPGYNRNTGFVSVYTGTMTVFSQTIESPFATHAKFGEDIKVSSNGEYLFVAAPDARSTDQAYGKVAVYKQQAGKFNYLQTINNPRPRVGMKFGQAIDVNEDATELVISAVGLNRNVPVTFDQYSQLLAGADEYVNDPFSDETDDNTTFDSQTTRFFDTIIYSGASYVYNRKTDLFRLANELLPTDTNTGTNFGYSVAMNENSIYVGAPAYRNRTLPDEARSAFYQFYKNDLRADSWKTLRSQDDLVDVETIQKIALVDSFNEEVIEYLDVIDPLKGKISGLAEQDLTYKSTIDPAVYTVGNNLTVVDPDTSWLDDHVGELWWDLSTAKFVMYEQGDLAYRKNNWGKLFPGASIDVYEWVRSDLLPSEWASIADTPEGLTRNVSGQPKYIDNSVVSVKQVYNYITNSFVNEYYYWVKNKVIVPDTKNRRISARQVASLIEDPTQYGLRYAAVIDSDAIALANIGNTLVGDRVNINVSMDEIKNKIPRHTEWLLLQENSANSVPNALLEKKLIDSLLGHDSLGNLVPDPALSYRQKYGIGIRPRQAMFKDRVAALRNLIEFINGVLIKNRITGNYSFKNLNKQDLIPHVEDGEYDLIVEDNEGLEIIDTRPFVQAQIICTVDNGKIRSVQILEPGLGYRIAPSVTISGNLGADIRLRIDSVGRVIDSEIVSAGNGFNSAPELEVRPFTVIVENDAGSNNKWSKFIYDKNVSNWVRVQTQKYNTKLYWHYIDWADESFNKYVDYVHTIDEVYQLETLEDIIPGQYIKIKNAGLGKFIIVEKTQAGTLGNFSRDYNVVYCEEGTIQINESIWNFNNLGFDKVLGIDQTLYDQTPDLELENILLALKNDIFVNELKVNWNKFFFTAVKYALSEQKLLDWAFKTSFINVTNYAGSLDQRPIYKLQNSSYYEDYLKEVKPYHTKIRRFTTNYSNLENGRAYTTDFDLPAYYNTETNKFEVIEISASVPKSQFTISNSLTTVYPYKSWADNYTFGIGSISIANSGQGYATEPTVTILPALGDSGTGATAKAYIRSGEIYEIEVTNAGTGYLVPPQIYISGGGPSVVTTASAYANLYNGRVRSTKIGLKFDRTTRISQIRDLLTTDRFVADGSRYEFELNWLAVPDKLDFTVKLDGSIVLNSEYTVIYDEEFRNDLEEHTVKFCKLVFLNFVPRANQIIEVSYIKNIDLLNAVDRITNYYAPKSGMPGTETSQLISGIVYPKTKIEALKFDYTTKWDLDYSVYGETAWADDIGFYFATTSTNTATAFGSTWTSIILNSVTGIVPGQFANVISTTTNAFTTASVRVVSVNSATKTVVLNTSTSTILAPGTEIEFWNYSADLTILDSAIDGGTWNTATRITALGINPEDISIIGDGFITPNTSYAPDELIPGEVNESLGISVFTKNPEGAPIVVNSYFNTVSGSTSTQRLRIVPPNYASVRVKFNDTILAYNSTTDFISADEFSIDWNTNEIIVPPQSVNGKVSYTIVSVGGGRESVEAGVIDSASVTSDDGGSVQVVSLAEYGTVKSAYVTVNGISTSNFSLGPVNAGSNRAAVVVDNLTTGTTSTVTAWFFGTANKYFNEIVEQEFSPAGVSTTFIPLEAPPGIIEPVSAQIIVEYTDSMGTRYLRPPHVDYYQVTNTLTKVYTINNDGYYLAPSSVRTFINGNELRKGFDFKVIDVSGTYKVSIFVDISLNDVIAIVALPQNAPHVDYDYDVVNNTLVLTNSVSTGTFKIITFTNHDDMMTRTERFNGTPNRRYKLSRPVLDENYVWVVVNGIPLINKYDYEILDDMVTVQVSDQFEHNWNYTSQTGDDVVITSISSAKLSQEILGYRIFNDIFDRTHYKRLSKENTTYLTKPLYFTDTEIHVADASVLRPPIVAKNLPGIILIDGERIEFFQINGNVLTQLRRSTLGTAPAFYCEEMTKVMDQSVEQTVPFTDQIKRQDQLTVSGQNSYTIQTIEHIYSTGTYQQFVNDGIVLSSAAPAVDQIKVFYGGRPLRKTGQFEHDISVTWDNQQADLSAVDFISNVNNLPETEVIGKSYIESTTNKVWVYEDSSAESAVKGYVYKGLRWAPPEFTVTTSTQQITLNIENGVQDGVLLTVVKKEFARNQVWNTELTTSTTKSLMDSETVPAKFLKAKPAELPDKYYYGGDPALTEDSGFAITDQNDKPLQGY